VTRAREVADEELDDAVARYRAEGWALLPNVVSHESLAALRERAAAYMAGRHPDPGLFFQAEGETGRYADVAKVPGWSGDRWYRKIEKLERDPLYRAWIASALFARVVTRIHPPSDGGPLPDATLYRAVLFSKAARFGSDTPWHQDGGRLWGLSQEPELQLWTALDDAPVEAGCLEVLPGSHRAGLATPLGGVVSAALVAATDADRRALPVPARAGDVVLLHPHLWHRAGPNPTAAPRRALTACFLPADARCVRTRRAARVFAAIFRG
jgi:hypothetical protein